MKRLLLCIYVLALLPFVTAVTINSVTLSPQNATTAATLECTMNATGAGAIEANITWFRNGAAHATDNETLTLTTDVENSTSVLGNVEPADTTKGDVWICQATVGDGTNVTAQNSSSLTIINTVPSITFPTVTQSLTEDIAYNQNATASDADGDSIVTFISADLNQSQFGAALFSIGSGGGMAVTPNQSMVGNHTMAILAFDGEGWGGINTLFSVALVNDSPIFDPSLANQTGAVSQAFSYTVTGSDEESDPFNFSVQASRPTVYINQTNATQAVISFIGGYPISADEGLIEVNVTVYSEGDASANTTETIYLNITKPNASPALGNMTDQNGTQGALFTFFMYANDSDVNDTVNFTITPSCSITNPWTLTMINESSANATGLINVTLTNDHVICRTVTITAYDYLAGVARGASNSTTLFFNITNINDAPTLYNLSANTSNTYNQTDMRNLTAATYVSFVYTVNGTDPDLLTYESDTITFTDDSPLFVITPTTGIISFTPGLVDVGNYIINITLTDSNGSSVTAPLNLTIVSNGFPIVTPIGQIDCIEDAACFYNFTASDPDEPENITFSFSSLVSATQLDNNTSQMSNNFTNNQVGVYNITVTATDSFLHSNSSVFVLNITNTNDAPYFDNDVDTFADTISMPSPVVITFATYWLINITELDLRNDVSENITFTSAITTGPNASLFSISKLNNTQALISFTPAAADIGNYTVNITATDAYGLNATQLVNFVVYNTSVEPVITAAQPYLNGTVQINDSLTVTASSSTTVSFPENTNVTFNISYADVDTIAASVLVRYYRNGTLVSSATGASTAYSWSLDYFSAGIYNITVVVQDDLLSADNFTWIVNVTNVNRQPVLVEQLENRTINMTALLSREMAAFVDPDDDVNSNGILDLSETSTLSFVMSSTSLLTASFSGVDVLLTPVQSGVTDVYYTATDPYGLTADSNNVTYYVFFFPEPTPTPSSGGSSGGGGGGGGGGSQIITRRVEVPKPYAIDILVPQALTIYENETVIAPVSITNTGTTALQDISLTARTDANVTLNWLDDSIGLLEVNETYNTSLAITNYRYGGTFEVYITGSVEEPSFNDSAVLYINSIEKSSEGAAVNVKVTYARDLLAANPACGELVQLVNQAEQALRNGDSKTAQELLAAVDEGCTFLKAQSAAEVQTPSLLRVLAGYQYVNAMLAGLLVLLLVIGGMLVMHYAKQQ